MAIFVSQFDYNGHVQTTILLILISYINEFAKKRKACVCRLIYAY